MRTVIYTMSPDVAGSFLKKEALLSQFAQDVRWVFYRRNVPPLFILNEALSHGASPREAEWEPFSIQESEYLELIETIKGEPPLGYRVLQSPPEIKTHHEWQRWVEANGL